MNHDIDRTLLIEILTYLLEELDQSRQKYLRGVGVSRRQQFTQYLTRIAPNIIHLLQKTLVDAVLVQQTEQSINQQRETPKSPTDKLIAKIYRCLGAWINIIDPKDIRLVEPLLNYVFESLQDEGPNDLIHDAAADTVCGAVLLCENYTKYQHLTHYLLNQIYKLENVYHHSVSNEEIDKSVNYSRIFTEMAESIVSPLIVDVASEQSNFNIPELKIIDLLLHCIGHYDYEVAEITFHFWFRFTELIHKKSSLLPLFSSISNKLIHGLTRHCQLECDQEGLLSIDSNLYEFRLRVRDLIKEVIFIVGAKNYIKDSNLVGDLETNLQQLSHSSPNVNWEEVEAQLFILSCIVADIKDDDPLILSIINLVLQTNSANLHTQIFATNCTILGELSQWLETNHQYINPILNYLLTIITSTNQNNNQANTSSAFQSSGGGESSTMLPVTLASISANSLQKIIDLNSSKDLHGNLQLIKILIEICSQLDAIANEEAAHNLLKCCTTIIGIEEEAQQPEIRQSKEELIVRLLSPCVDIMNAVVCGRAVKSDAQLGVYLDRISAVFKHLRSSQPSTELSLISQLCTQQIWPIIQSLLNKTANSKELSPLVEKSCRCLRSIIRFLKPAWLLIPIANTIVNLYQINPAYSTYLYLSSILVDEFGATTDPKISDGLISMLNAFCMPTFNLLQQDSQLKNHPDTIDDFFRLCTRFLQKNPEKFLTNQMLEPILNLTVASLSLDQRDANKSVTKFIDELFSSAKNKNSTVCDDVLRSMLVQKNFGQQLLQTALMAGLVNLPSYFIAEMGDVIWRILNWNKRLSAEWLRVSLSGLPSQTNLGLNVLEPTQLEEFYNNLVK